MKKFETSQQVEEIKRNWPYEFTTEEIKAELGTFETEFEKNYTGPKTHNEILGPTVQGIVDWALANKWIFKREDGNYFVILPGYYEYKKLLLGLQEIKCRREYAKREEYIQQSFSVGEETDGMDDIRDVFKQIRQNLQRKGLFLTSI